LVAGSLDNLATSVWRTGQLNEAIRYYKEAIRRGKKALERDPQNEMARRFQAEHHAKLGILLTEIGRRSEAEAHQNEAFSLRKKLLADFPADPEYPQILALSHNTLGTWQADLGQWDEAESEHRKARDLRLEGVKRFPKRPDRQIELAVSYVSLGNLTRDRGQPQHSLDWYSKANAATEPMQARESRYVPVRDVLRDAHSGRARALDRLGRYAEAVEDWEQAAKLDDGMQRAALKIGRAISEAHVKGDHREAISDAQVLAKDADGPTLGGLARLCALASRPSGSRKEPAATAAVCEEYAALAVVLLRQAALKGFRDTLYLQKGPDLVALRDRKDFQMLLEDREASTDRHSP
jgi:tetratricopeptide (TPR) repeat protein